MCCIDELKILKAELKASVAELFKMHSALFEDVQQMKKLFGRTTNTSSPVKLVNNRDETPFVQH